MPKPGPLPKYVARGTTKCSDGQSAETEEEKISEEQSVTDPLLVSVPGAGGITIGPSSGGYPAQEKSETPPEVRIRPVRKPPIDGPFLDPDGSVDYGKDEEPEDSTQQLLEAPSLFELYRERLVQKYNFAEDDPVFALAEIYSEAERRALARNMATESSCARMVAEMQNVLSLVREHVAKLEDGFRNLEVFEQSAVTLRCAAGTLEEIVMQQKEETLTRLQALDLLQKDLTKDVNNALGRRITDRLLVVFTVFVGIMTGPILHWFFGR
jgi:hypothetical protein